MEKQVDRQVEPEVARKPKKPRKPKLKLDRKLPKGIRPLAIEEGQPRPYGVSRLVNGKRKAAFFPSIDAVNEHIDALIEARRDGDLSLVPTRAEIAEWRAIKAAIGLTPMMEVVAGWKSWLNHSVKKVSTLRVDKAVLDYLELQRARRDNKPAALITADTYRQKRTKLERFSRRFGAALMADITPALLKHWVNVDAPADWSREHPLKTPKTTFAHDSCADHLRKVRELYNHYHKELPDNPADAVELGQDLSDNDPIMPVLHIAETLAFALEYHPECVLRLATEIFVGVRTSTVGRLKRASFDIEDSGLDLLKRDVKTKSDHYITTMPANYWSWVAAGWSNENALKPEVKSDWMHRKSRLFIASEKPLQHNGMRHAFCSYHLTAYEDPARTALILCHKNMGMLRRYEGKARKADGLWLFTLTPQNITQQIAARRDYESARASAGTPPR